MSALISVLLPVYNNEKTIAAAVNSILQQTYKHFELIILNDGSTDTTINILSGITDDRVVVLNGHENWGLPRRLNQGIDIAKGEYIARMDADDVSFPDRFQRQIDFMSTHHDIDVLGTRAVVMGEDHHIVGVLPFLDNHAALTSRPWQGIPLAHPTWMMRSTWAKKYRYKVPEVWRAEDQELLLRASAESCYAALPDILLCYYQGQFNLKKSLLARTSLSSAQFSYFWDRKDVVSCLRVLMVTSLRICMDILQHFVGVSIFRQMKWNTVLDDVQKESIYRVWGRRP